MSSPRDSFFGPGLGSRFRGSLWAAQVAERRGRPVAVVAMARKLAGVLYAMWRDGVEYEPRKLTAEAGVP